MKLFDPRELNRNLFLIGFSIFSISIGADWLGLGDTEFHIGWVQGLGMVLGIGFIFLGIMNRYYGLTSIQIFSKQINQIFEQRSVPSLQRPPSVALTVACIVTILWQSTFALAADKLDRTYINRAASGMGFQYSFVYFYYYENLYPVFSTMNDVFYHDWQKASKQPVISGFVQPEYSKQAAESLLKNHPETLLMELGWTIRPGDDGKTLLFFPEAILRGTPEGAGVTWFLSWVFILSLVALLIASYYTNNFLLGIFLVAFLGSHPFQLAEVYNKGNFAQMGGITWFTGQVFSLPISLIIFLLALHFPLIFNRNVSKYYFWLMPIVSGALIASARQVRGENSTVIVSLLICYVLVTCIPWRGKLLMIILVITSFWMVSQGWSIYFRNKFIQTYHVVEDVGGSPLPLSDKLQNHPFWSTVWAGLGDFDLSKGYAWSDATLYSYVCPILESQGKLEGGECRDLSGIYAKVPWTIPGFEIISRDKVLKDIGSDPLWYVSILLKRIQRILTDVAPPRLGLGVYYFDIPLSGGLLIPLLILLALIRSWSHIRLILFTLPLAIGALMVYSGNGMTYYSVFVQIMAAICCVALLRSAVWGYGMIRAEWRRLVLVEGKMSSN